MFIACDNVDEHGNLSIFEDPSPEKFSEWVAVDSTYYRAVLPMINLYKESAKLNFNGNPWKNRRFQLEYSELTWRSLYDFVNYYSDLYDEVGIEEGDKILDSLNNRFDQMRDELITWKEEN